MQFTTLIVAALASVAIATDLPPCAQKCFDDNFPKSGCSSKTDYECICKYVSNKKLAPKYITAVGERTCVLTYFYFKGQAILHCLWRMRTGCLQQS